MPKRISNRTPDVNQAAHLMVERSTAEPNAPERRVKPPKRLAASISAIMSQMGRKGGKIGGKRRLLTMTPEERSQVAMKAAQARWAKKK